MQLVQHVKFLILFFLSDGRSEFNNTVSPSNTSIFGKRLSNFLDNVDFPEQGKPVNQITKDTKYFLMLYLSPLRFDYSSKS